MDFLQAGKAVGLNIVNQQLVVLKVIAGQTMSDDMCPEAFLNEKMSRGKLK